LSVYVAVKLPVLFLGTTAIVAAINWMAASVMGAGLSFRRTLLAVFAAMAVEAWILLAMLPVALFFLWAVIPTSGTNDELRYAHNCMLMTHIVILAAAGFAGNAALLSGLRSTVKPSCPATALFMTWVFMFAFVGCQMSWILRPFVGSPFYPVAFMRPDAMDRNFYEFVFTEVLPFMAGQD
jgi:predicted histidine transporter YuiF (NhaC family)